MAGPCPARRPSANHDGVGEPFEVGVSGDEGGAEATRGGIDERVGHRQAMGEGEVSGVQRERLIHGRDGRAAERRYRLDGALLADVTSDDLVDLVDLDRADEQGVAPLDVRCEAIGFRPIGQILDPAAGVDQDQRRSFFSRSPLGLTPRAIPR